MKPGRSSKLEAAIGFEDCGGSVNSPLGAENWLIERESMEKDKRKEKVKEKIHGQTKFEDNYRNCSPTTAPEMLVGIS